MCIVNAASEKDMAVFASGMIQVCSVTPFLEIPLAHSIKFLSSDI